MAECATGAAALSDTALKLQQARVRLIAVSEADVNEHTSKLMGLEARLHAHRSSFAELSKALADERVAALTAKVGLMARRHMNWLEHIACFDDVINTLSCLKDLMSLQVRLDGTRTRWVVGPA